MFVIHVRKYQCFLSLPWTVSGFGGAGVDGQVKSEQAQEFMWQTH